jgi:hypothetical protein
LTVGCEDVQTDRAKKREKLLKIPFRPTDPNQWKKADTMKTGSKLFRSVTSDKIGPVDEAKMTAVAIKKNKKQKSTHDRLKHGSFDHINSPEPGTQEETGEVELSEEEKGPLAFESDGVGLKRKRDRVEHGHVGEQSEAIPR